MSATRGLVAFIEWLLLALFGSIRSERPRALPAAGPEVPEGFVIGAAVADTSEPEGTPIAVTEKSRAMHMAITGATGCGKTTAILRLIASDIEAGRTVVVIDRRNDFVKRLEPRLAAAGVGPERVILVDAADEGHTFAFNPLGGRGDALGRSLGVLALLRREAEGWGVQIDETCRCALSALSESGHTLLETEALLTNPAFRASVLARVTDPYVLGFFARFDALSPEKQLAWTLPITNKLSPFLSVRPLRNMLGSHGGPDFRAVLDTPGTVVLIGLGVDRLRQAADLAGGMFLTAVQQAVLGRVDVPERDRTPVRLYCDEFEAMVTDDFATVVQEGRRFGLHLTLAHQNLSQIPTRMLETIRNNCALRMMFNCGPMDAAHLAPELQGMAREEARAALTSLGVGEAFLVRRGQEVVRVQTPDTLDPKVDPELVADLRERSLARWCVPAHEAESAIAARHAAIAAMSEARQAPTKEVRHGRRPRIQ